MQWPTSRGAVLDSIQRLRRQAQSAGTLQTTDPGIGGADTILTGSGEDVVLGGPAGDRIDLGAGNDLALGDDGNVRWAVLDALKVLRDPKSAPAVAEFLTTRDRGKACEALKPGDRAGAASRPHAGRWRAHAAA